MAKAVTIGEAKTNFSKLVRRAEAGEEIVVRRGREPVARIMPLKKRGGVRGFGSMKSESGSAGTSTSRSRTSRATLVLDVSIRRLYVTVVWADSDSGQAMRQCPVRQVDEHGAVRTWRSARPASRPPASKKDRLARAGRSVQVRQVDEHGVVEDLGHRRALPRCLPLQIPLDLRGDREVECDLRLAGGAARRAIAAEPRDRDRWPARPQPAAVVP